MLWKEQGGTCKISEKYEKKKKGLLFDINKWSDISSSVHFYGYLLKYKSRSHPKIRFDAHRSTLF